jgi:ergothioneine biosynthesis protein EgtB
MHSETQTPVAPPTSGLQRLRAARARTDELFALVRPEALIDRPVAERHRLIFYLGHLESFDWNLLSGPLNLQAFHPEFDRLFAFGIDPQSELPDEPASSWPQEEAVREYDEQLRGRLDARLAELEAPPVADGQPLLEVAIEHRLMHAETLSFLLQRLPYERKRAPPHDAPPTGRDPGHASASIPAGRATLGRRRNGFGWDNEFEELVVDVPAFDIDVHDVSNARFLRFVEADGYSEPRWWTPSDWAWLQATRRTHPASWLRTRDGWTWRGPWSQRELPGSWPVYVSHAEAAAYARWLGRRLPSEAQFHRAAYGTPEGEERSQPWGSAPPDASRGVFDFTSWEPHPVGSHPRGASAFGVHDLVGNGWEWTRSEFAPLPGFRAFDFYPGYSRDFFEGRHFVLKGAGPRTAARLVRRSFRNWFQPHLASLHATFRTVDS